jgi:hypothetical protein
MNLEYHATDEEKKDDEVEDLFVVLKEVKELYPDI